MGNIITYTKGALRYQLDLDNPVIYRHNWKSDSKWRRFELCNEFELKIGSLIILFEKGFQWDGSSVPSWLHWWLRPFGKFDIAYLLHDKLYQCCGSINGYTLSRKRVDKLMLEIALELVDTKQISLRRIDHYLRYYVVRLVGWYLWNRNLKKLSK